MASEIHLIPDSSVVPQFFIFITVLIGLSFLVFRPIKRILSARRAKGEALIAETRALEERIRTTSEEYLAKIAKARASANIEKDAIRQTGMKEEEEIRESARLEARKQIEKVRSDIEASSVKAMNELKAQMPRLVEEIVKKVRE